MLVCCPSSSIQSESMKYQFKVVLFWLLELLPCTNRLYWIAQRRVLKRHVFSDSALSDHRRQCDLYLESYRSLKGSLPRDVYEFGAGWLLYSPFIFASKGFSVTASDLKPLAKRRPNADLAKEIGVDIEDVKYVAPCDASASNLADSSFDLICSTSVLEHIPKNKMPSLASECHRLLHPGGVCCFHVAHRDHWSHVDQNCHPMNYLRFSPFLWAFLNPPLNYQNRMLQSEYVSCFESAGFEVRVTSVMVEPPVRVHCSFSHLSPKDHSVTHSYFVLHKRAQSNSYH